MKQLLQIFIFSAFFFISAAAQGNLTPDQSAQKLLEENGIAGEIIPLNSDDSPLSVVWTSIPDAPEPFGRSIGGKIGDFIYVFGGQANSSMAIAYQISQDTWLASTVPTSPAYNPSFCVANAELYKLSGSGSVSVFEKFTPDGGGTGNWTVLTSGPTGIMNTQSTMA